ncbi:deoxynucleotide monophosphate kinase family protein [Streptomyces erythrochromogenes]|uniref:deoxynucleotide monophosphate kinase family protein n=1 Tax=Streptomyces erythrochromogenes TaxID=285574 RepID=UPI0037D71E35
MRDVAIIGRARSGKDSVGARLVNRYGYTRLAFADQLKDMALEINPLVPTSPGVHVRLHRLVMDVGWEYAKETYPEVRRILQHSGQTVRRYDRDFWVRALAERALECQFLGKPVVVTDVRYPNEADTLRVMGFRLVRIVRPSLGDLPEDAHESETALEGYPVGVTILNNATLEDLYAHADSIAH